MKSSYMPYLLKWVGRSNSSHSNISANELLKSFQLVIFIEMHTQPSIHPKNNMRFLNHCPLCWRSTGNRQCVSYLHLCTQWSQDSSGVRFPCHFPWSTKSEGRGGGTKKKVRKYPLFFITTWADSSSLWKCFLIALFIKSVCTVCCVLHIVYSVIMTLNSIFIS